MDMKAHTFSYPLIDMATHIEYICKLIVHDKTIKVY